jgi:hypothetical protein
MFSRLSLASIFDNMRARSSQKERDRIEQLASNSSRNKTNKKKNGGWLLQTRSTHSSCTRTEVHLRVISLDCRTRWLMSKTFLPLHETHTVNHPYVC